MTEQELEKKLDTILRNQAKSLIFTQLLLSWTGMVVGYVIGIIAPTAFVLGVSNIIIIISSLFFIISLIRFIRTLKNA